jgi:plasmid stability protein
MMSTITISDLDHQLAERLIQQAARHGQSIEDEAGDILSNALAQPGSNTANLAASIRARFGPLGGVELPDTHREPTSPGAGLE